jgi:hypothetical protein
MRNPESASDLELQVSSTVERLRIERRLRPEMLCAVAGFSRASYYVTGPGRMSATCEACGDPVDELEESCGRFHRRCVERLLAARRRAGHLHRVG